MHRRLVVATMLASALLTGCASWFEGSSRPEPTRLAAFNPVQGLAERWSASLGDSGTGGFMPAYHNGNIVAADARGQVREFDATTGRQVRQLDAGRPLTGAVGVSEELLLLGTAKGSLIALDRRTGTVRWEQRLTSLTLEAPVVSGGQVMVRTNDGRITAFGLADGQRRWTYAASQPLLTLRNTGSMTPVGTEALIIGQAGGRIAVLAQESGALLWEATVATARGATELERVTDVTSRPAFDNGQVCAVAYQGRVACFEARSGTLQWARDISSSQGLTLDERNVYVTADDGSVQAFDRSTGRNLWKLDALRYRSVSGPAMLGRFVLVTDQEGYAHLLSNETGAIVGRTRIGADLLATQPQSLGENVLLQGRNGRLAMLTLK